MTLAVKSTRWVAVGIYSEVLLVVEYMPRVHVQQNNGIELTRNVKSIPILM